MNTLKSLYHHLKDQPFVTAAALAALVHSCWTFSVFFAGDPPTGDNLAYAGWLIPGVLLAFAIDVGLLTVSARLKKHGPSLAKLITFGFLSLFMGYAQFLFSISHAPHIPISAGVRAEWISFVEFLRDLSIFVLPLMLPIAITLHSLDREKETVTTPEIAPIQAEPNGGSGNQLPDAPPTPEPSDPIAQTERPTPERANVQDYTEMLDDRRFAEALGIPTTETDGGEWYGRTGAEIFASGLETAREVWEGQQRAAEENSRPLDRKPSTNGNGRHDAPIVEEF